MQAMWKHRRSLLDRGASGRFGRLGACPSSASSGCCCRCSRRWSTCSPVYGLFFLDREATAVAWLAMLGRADRSPPWWRSGSTRRSCASLWVLPLQQFVYRQLMYLVMIQSVVTALTGGRLGWQKLHRTGLEPAVRNGG